MEDITDLRFKESLSKVNPTGSIQHNPSFTISNTDEVVASTKIVTKTIGATSYQKTISYNAADDVVNISVWSEV